MDAMEALLTRRSIRRFTTDPVPDETVDRLLAAAMHAPSATDEQPWQFVVIRDRALIEGIRAFHPHSLMLKEAPLAILVCGDTKLEQHPGYWVVDCGAATENLLLAAHALGLGAVWLGIYPRPERLEAMTRLLGLPPHILPFSLIALGHPDEVKQQPKGRFKPERIHRDQW